MIRWLSDEWQQASRLLRAFHYCFISLVTDIFIYFELPLRHAAAAITTSFLLRH